MTHPRHLLGHSETCKFASRGTYLVPDPTCQRCADRIANGQWPKDRLSSDEEERAG